MKKLVLLMLVILLLPVFSFSQDNQGNPLPRTIPQPVYDRVIANSCTAPDGPLDHWTRCGHWVQHLEDLLAGKNPGPAPENPDPIPGLQCDSGKSWGSDGSLWKPVSESNGFPVILLPCSYNGASSVVVFGPDGGREASIQSRNYCRNPNAKNPSGRSHFNVQTRARDIDDNSVVAITLHGHTECRRIPSPTRRYE